MASKRRIRKKAHDGKQAFNNQEDAKKQAGRMFGLSGQFIAAYKCGFGNHWHIGHYKAGSHRR